MSVPSRYDIPGISATELVRGEESTLEKVPAIPMSELYDFMTGDPYPSIKRAAAAEFMRRLDLVDDLLGIETVSWKQD
jgi:hypothetical protein